MHQISREEDWDPVWNTEDRARYLTLAARFPSQTAAFLDCVVWKRKFPGLSYNDDVEKMIRTCTF